MNQWLVALAFIENTLAKEQRGHTQFEHVASSLPPPPGRGQLANSCSAALLHKPNRFGGLDTSTKPASPNDPPASGDLPDLLLYGTGDHVVSDLLEHLPKFGIRKAFCIRLLKCSKIWIRREPSDPKRVATDLGCKFHLDAGERFDVGANFPRIRTHLLEFPRHDAHASKKPDHDLHPPFSVQPFGTKESLIASDLIALMRIKRGNTGRREFVPNREARA